MTKQQIKSFKKSIDSFRKRIADIKTGQELETTNDKVVPISSFMLKVSQHEK